MDEVARRRDSRPQTFFCQVLENKRSSPETVYTVSLRRLIPNSTLLPLHRNAQAPTQSEPAAFRLPHLMVAGWER